MAVLYKWFGLVLYALTRLTIAITEAKCGGRTLLTDLQGTISDGPNKYPENTLCEWLIKGPYPNVSITLTFIEFTTECSYDFLFIHDGDSYLSPLIGSLSGNTLPKPIVAHSGQMLINLYSDTNYSLQGFTLNYTIENCTQGCSGNGMCKDGHCVCGKYYRGEACDLATCPSQCGTAEGHGQCNFAQVHYCECKQGYIGESCSLLTLGNADSNKWFDISSTSSVFTPRIAHSIVYIEKSDTLLAFGGYSLSEVFDDLLQFNFTTSQWSVLQPGAPKPVGRFSHSANLYFDSMVVLGGESYNGTLRNDLWIYNATLNKWTELAVNSVVKPLPVSEHTGTVVDDKLYIFGGRTSSEPFSSAMYSYSLSSQSGWTKVSYKQGNEHHLRVLGHSAVYYPYMHSIIVFGGFVPERPRFSARSNKLLAFHLDLHVWTELNVAASPRGRAFHSAVLVGDYMIIYGGNIHEHDKEELCYENKSLFYHLKCQKWIPQTTFEALSSPSSNPQRGRFSHRAVLRNGNVMLAVGGFSGVPLGDVLGYKLPVSVAEKSSVGGHCSGYSTEKSCKDDPECGWCSTVPKCQNKTDSCAVTLLVGTCPGQCAVYTQCSSCISFGQTHCGWCVQDSRCYPTASRTGACQTVTNDNRESLRGWWGSEGQFLTSLNDCQSTNFPPGITVVENKAVQNYSFPDGVRIASKSEVKILPATKVFPDSVEEVHRTQLIGFIYPFKYQSEPWKTYQLRLYFGNAKHSDAKLWISTDDTEANIELVAHCKTTVLGSCDELAARSNNQDIFPSPSAEKKYFVKAELNKSVKHGDSDSLFSFKWNRTSSNYQTEALSGQFLQPYTTSVCSVYKSCLACMTDASCGWCVTTCVSRNSPACLDGDGNQKNLVLNASECTVCSDHVDCSSCNQDTSCVWGAQNGCYRQGVVLRKSVDNCNSPCLSRKTCDSCLSDSIGCTWCDKTQSCFVFGTYTSRYPYGQCSHWIDSDAGGQCSNCSRHTTCKSCLADVRCGWCGNDYDPRIGRCFSGDFNSPYSGQCPTIFPTNGSTTWSYTACPDIDECKLGIAQCHHNATCVNLPDSFNCICNRGYTGDGKLACNKTCFHDCGIHGVCGADYICDCNLGWLGENCSTDCGCNGHSDCSQGIGICDKCQDYTHGNHCELCIPGSFGNATTAEGCKPCQCNGHGDPSKNLCHISTGKCFCTDFTMGDHCDRCNPGLVGNPKNGGLCFHQCLPRSILTNITQGFISTSKSAASCLWLISSVSNTSHEVVYGPSPPPVGSRGYITLTFNKIHINCLTDHVDVYDGLPPFLLDQSSSLQPFYKLGSFCGWSANKLKSVTAMLGNMVVVIKANLKSGALSKGFSAKFNIKKCPEHCEGNQRCVVTSHGEQCVCLEGWTGVNCDQLVCPNNCSFSKGQGHCNLTLGGCVCSSGFAGPNCSQVITPGTGLWEVLSDVPDLNISTSYLARMGHTMVRGPGYLLVYGGFSLVHGLLNDLLSFNLSTNMWSHIEVNQVPSRVPDARFLHSAVFYADSMLVYGGQTKNGSADQSLWLFNTTTLQWNELKVTSQGPKVAGHTATLAGDDMVIIGGYDHFLGFNEATYKYNIVTKQWSVVQSNGLSPKGIYGHTAVYYAAKHVILVFGGYRFRIDRVRPSDALHSLDLNSNKWSLLQALPFNEPQPKYFHSAVILDGVMVVFGGRSNTTDQLFSNQLLIYNIKCNYWHLFPDHSLLGSKPGGLLSAAAVTVMDRVYIFGGFNGRTQATMFRLILPTDLCQSLTSKEKCVAVPTCNWCDVHNVTNQGNITLIPTNQSACFSVMSSVPAICHAKPNITQVVFHNGSDCSMPSTRPCESFYSCSACLASFPHPSSMPNCQWCVECPLGGKCIKPSETCNASNPCFYKGQFHSQHTLQDSKVCPANNCEAASCPACLSLGGCFWTPQLAWSSEVLRLLATFESHPYSWNCFITKFTEQVATKSVTLATCPKLCTEHTTCFDCLESKGGDGGWKECVWSETLGQCFSPSYLPIICLAGRCGRVIRGSSSGCMGSCVNNQQCSTCMSNYHCGWCGEEGIRGEGRCLEGGLHGPLRETCEANNVTTNTSRVWASTLCPLEDECLNGRHNCNQDTQVCLDTPKAFKCVCKQGYDDTAQPGTCEPVCSKGCDQGRCVRPEVCECHFGWTSTNCSVKCLCNEHGQCINETHLDVCHDCQNHTVGRRCEFCKPLYVGDARDNGSCVSCYDVCSKKADVCMNLTQLEYGRSRNFSFEPSEVKLWLKQGPYKIEHDEECLCKNSSNGVKCDSCVPGFFDHLDSCIRCLCNGHADSCDNKGTCKCQNNTEEDCSSPNGCYRHQCIKCKDQFMGSPVNNQQCYRKISFMQEFVIGHKTAETGEQNIDGLSFGQTIFYAIYPRFTNVNIRLTTDVFTGEVDLYVTSENDEFMVEYNHTTGHHEVNIRSLGNSPSNARKRRSTEYDSGSNMVDEVVSSDMNLNTFTTYNDKHRALIVRGVRKRLIITFPHVEHHLRDTRFYMVFVGRDKSGSKGLVYFRQDQSQIDLFVFFSVFFSAFFLIVSVSVFGWKIKQYHTRRRVIEVREYQLETMRSRPFATYSFLHQKNKPQPSCWRVKHDTATHLLREPSTIKHHQLRLRDVRERPVLAPISQEPTGDGRACVTTVVFQLPGNECSDFQLLLGSSLTLVSNQYSVSGVEHHANNGRKASTRRTVTLTS